MRLKVNVERLKVNVERLKVYVERLTIKGKKTDVNGRTTIRMVVVLCPGRCPSLCRLCPYRAFALRTVVVLCTLNSVLSPFLLQNYIHIPTPANRRYQWTNRQKLYPLIINAINIITITTKSISLRTYLQFQKINSAKLFQPLLRKSFPSYENKIISLENKIILLGNFRRSNYTILDSDC